MEYSFLYKSKVGNLIIKTDGISLTGLEYEDPNNPLLIGLLINLEIVNDTIRWLDMYFNNEIPDIKLDIKPNGTEFQKDVWNIVKDIPYGTTLTYKEVTAALEKKYNRRISYQAVGTAIGKNPIAIIIPCHRVVGKSGIGGYSGGLDRKRILLDIERIDVK